MQYKNICFMHHVLLVHVFTSNMFMFIFCHFVMDSQLLSCCYKSIISFVSDVCGFIQHFQWFTVYQHILMYKRDCCTFVLSFLTLIFVSCTLKTHNTSATRGRPIYTIYLTMKTHPKLLLQNCTTFIHLRLFSFYFTFGFTPSLSPSPSVLLLRVSVLKETSSDQLESSLAELVSFTFHRSSCHTQK